MLIVLEVLSIKIDKLPVVVLITGPHIPTARWRCKVKWVYVHCRYMID